MVCLAYGTDRPVKSRDCRLTRPPMDISAPRLEPLPNRATDIGARVRTTRVESWESAPDLDAAWTGLLERCAGCSVFQAFPWQLCWWRAFGGSHGLLVVLAHAGSRLVGIAPMMVTREKFSLGRVRRRLHFKIGR